MPIRRMDWRGELRRMPQLPWDFYSQSSIQCTCLTIMETSRKLTSCKDCLVVPLCHNSPTVDPCGCWRGRWWPPLHPYCVPYTGLKSKVKVNVGCMFCFVFPFLVLFYIPIHTFCFVFPSICSVLNSLPTPKSQKGRRELRHEGAGMLSIGEMSTTNFFSSVYSQPWYKGFVFCFWSNKSR